MCHACVLFTKALELVLCLVSLNLNPLHSFRLRESRIMLSDDMTVTSKVCAGTQPLHRVPGAQNAAEGRLRAEPLPRVLQPDGEAAVHLRLMRRSSEGFAHVRRRLSLLMHAVWWSRQHQVQIAMREGARNRFLHVFSRTRTCVIANVNLRSIGRKYGYGVGSASEIRRLGLQCNCRAMSGGRE